MDEGFEEDADVDWLEVSEEEPHEDRQGSGERREDEGEEGKDEGGEGEDEGEDKGEECKNVYKVIYKLLFLRKNTTIPKFLYTAEVLSGKNIRYRLANLLFNSVTDGTLVKALTGCCLDCSVNMETTFDSDRGKLNFFFSRHLHLFRSAQMVLQGFDLEFFFSSWKECVCSSCLELLKSKTNIRQGSFFLDLPLWLISRFFVAVM